MHRRTFLQFLASLPLLGSWVTRPVAQTLCPHCGNPLAGPPAGWPADFQPTGADSVPPGCCNGLCGPPGPPGPLGDDVDDDDVLQHHYWPGFGHALISRRTSRLLATVEFLET